MPGNLAEASARFVAKLDRAKGKRLRECASNARRRIRIVIASNPDPFAPVLQLRQQIAIGRGHSGRAFAVVKTVAERNNDAGRVPGHQCVERLQCGAGVVRRQQHAAAREARSFFEMQVSDAEKATLGEISSALGI